MPGLILSNQTFKLPAKGLLPHMDFSCLLDEPSCFLVKSSYETYPIQTFNSGKWNVYLEGMIYDRTADELQNELQIFFSEKEFKQDELAEWTKNRDGEFLLVAVDSSSSSVVIANDVFGRLPVYFYKDEQRILISREIGVVLDLFQPEFEQYSLASYLLLGYAIGNKTIWKGVTKIPGHTILSINLKGNSNTQKTYSFAERFFQNRGRIATAEELTDKLALALGRRMNACGKSALALSGGLDSRIVAGLVKKSAKKLLMLTYTRDENGGDRDVLSAKEVAGKLGFEDQHTVIDLSVVSPAKADDLFRIKRGQNFLGMAYLLPFLEVFRDQKMTQITGDGGDKTLESLLPLKNLRTGKQLLDYILKRNSILPIEKVAEFTGLSVQSIKEYILPQLRTNNLSYTDCYACFILKERGFNWLFEGEDRNRYYAWTTTPFYAPDFFEAALSVPGKDKLYGKLFVQILKQLPGQTEDIVNPNWNIAPSDSSAVQLLFFKQQIKTKVPEFLLRLKGGKSNQTWKEFRRTVPFLPADIKIKMRPDWLKLKRISEADELPAGAFWYLISPFYR